MTLAPGDLSDRLMALHEQAHAELRNRDVFEGAGLLTARADEALFAARDALFAYNRAVAMQAPTQAMLHLRRAATHLQTAHVLCCSAEATIGREQRREVKIR